VLSLGSPAFKARHRLIPTSGQPHGRPTLSRGPVSTIAAHGRWAAGSPVVLSYIRAVDRWRDNALTGIGL